jgi:hypothetical protein
MKKIERLTLNVQKNREVMKKINDNGHYTVEQFINDGLRYVKAIKEGRVINSIGSVSSSGMSRTLKFIECHPYKGYDGKKRYNWYNFFALFKALGYTPVGKYGQYFRVHGCGMDMIFHTNYTNIHRLWRLGFITKKECEHLSQQTPTTI